MKPLRKLSSILFIMSTLITCQEKDPDPQAKLPPTGCDGDPTGTDCQQFFIAKGETLSYPTGTHIKATEGIEINGDIIIDPSTEGAFTMTATTGDIVIAGKILIKDTASGNSSGGRYKTGKSSSRLKDGKVTDGFTLTLDARGPNANIILKKGATLFSGRGQHAHDENLTSLSGYYEGAAGGNGGLIILNAPNGKVKLPEVGSTVTQFKDEVFVLGNGGNGANIKLDPNLEIGGLDVVEVRGGLGGNAGQLIIDADEIEGIPSLSNMENYPDFIYGGDGGHGGGVIWENAGNDKKYTLQEIIFHGGDGGDGAKVGGNGGFAYFTPFFDPISEIGDPVANVFCYGGDGGDVFVSPLPIQEVWGGNGGEYTANGINGWDGGEDKEGNLIRDGADGGNALGQGGNGGNILLGVNAYQAVGGSGGNSDEARNYLPDLLGNPELEILSSAFGVVGGNGGSGYSACEGCPGGNGGNAGTAKAIGGKGGDVLGEAIQSFGGDGGDIWALLRGTPGNGGNGNPGGEGGSQPPGIFLSENPGLGGEGSTEGADGETLGYDLNSDLIVVFNGETCGEDFECEGDTTSYDTPCTKEGATATYYFKELKPIIASENLVTGEIEYDDEEYIYFGQASVLTRDPVSNSVTSVLYSYSTKHTFKTGGKTEGNVIVFRDTTVTEEDSYVELGPFSGLPGAKGGFIGRWLRNPQCDDNGLLQWPGDGQFVRQWRNEGEERDHVYEWQLSGCVYFFQENSEIDRSHTQCCERSPDTPYPYQPCYKP